MAVEAPPGRGSALRRGCACLGRGFLLMALAGLLLAALAGGVVAAAVYSSLAAEIETGIAALEAAGEQAGFETSRITDRHGVLLWEIFGQGKRTRVGLAQIPQVLIDATIATEDDTFYQNIGLDAPSLLAALVANLRRPEERPQGASTITQQLVRHLAFSYEERTAVSYRRKTKEIVLAWVMNRRYTKDEILTLYLNEIYYGNLAYGVEAAAQTYFGKPAGGLNLAEASLLTGLPQSPAELDPYKNLAAAKERQWLVLNLMVGEGMISQAEAEAAYLFPLALAPQEVSLLAPHFAVYVRGLLEERFGPEVVANGGLRVTTSLDLKFQRLAELMARQHIAQVGPEHNMTNAALVALKPGSGEILAMLGSLDYRGAAIDGAVNVALTPQQPGSAIKPLTYAAALAPTPAGGAPAWTAADILWDVPVTYPQTDGSLYEPVNYDGRFHGPVRLRDALANSYNVPAVLLLQSIGVSRLVEFGGQMGIASWQADPTHYGLALTLGGGELTPLELTAAYAILANGGYRVPPAAILRVANAAGETLFEFQPPTPEPVLDPRAAFLVSDILDDDAARVPAMGRDNPLALPFPAAAKTGTTNDFRDNWTLGYTPGLAVGVWTGNSDNSPMLDISGLDGAAPLWSAYMQAVYSDFELMAALTSGGAQPPADFAPPAGLELRPICALPSISLGATDCGRDDAEWFLVGGQPPAPVGYRDGWSQLDPAVWQVPAVALAPAPAGAPGETAPPAAYCYLTPEAEPAGLPAEARPLLFLAPPRNPESLAPAQAYAHAHGLPIAPQAACGPALIGAPTRDPNALAFWQISSPRPGEAVSGVAPILGTADFDPARVQFYKLELGMGDPANPEWLTLGQTHSTPVVNGTLEMLHADALPAGDYLLRLIVVGSDGNYAGEPHTIAIRLE
ncbi:MAG: transglycosylase domain-containing protein [Candidatus Promineifilaceae bacterium]